MWIIFSYLVRSVYGFSRFFAGFHPPRYQNPNVTSVVPGWAASYPGPEKTCLDCVLDNVCHCITMTSMRIAKTISITLPPDLLLKAQKTAEREDRTISELFREALRRYITADPEWEALLRRTRSTGQALGIATETDVERLSDEFRQERLQSAAR